MSDGADELALSEEDLAELAAGVADVYERCDLHPFTTFMPWDAEDCSQLRAARDAGNCKQLAFLGGNRSGKSRLARQLTLAIALGADHPDVIAWAEMIGLDISAWPTGPGKAYVVALTNSDSRLYHRDEWNEDLIGHYPMQWWGKDSTGSALLKIWVPGYKKPAEIWFRSQDQGKKAFQGSAVRVINFDEEGDDIKLMEEASVRLSDQDGWMIFSATLFLKGKESWADTYFDPGGIAEKAGWKIHRLIPAHNPGGNFAALAAKFEHDPIAKEIRLYGRKATNSSTLVYPSWRPDKHVYDPTTMLTPSGRRVPPPKVDSWVFRGHDFGFRDPTVMLWAYLADEGVLVVYKEYYQPQRSTGEHCAAALEGGEVFAAWGDASARQEEMDWGLHGIMWTKAERNIRGGMKRVNDLLVTDRILVSKACENLIREIAILKRDTKKDEPIPHQSDHATDTLRYIVNGMIDESYLSPVVVGT